MAAIAAVVATSASGATSGGRLTTIAGGGSNASDQPGTAIPAKSAFLHQLSELAADRQGNVYFIVEGFNTVRKVRAGRITIIARGTVGEPTRGGLAVDRQGNVYFLASNVFKVTPGGKITMVAGRYEAPADTPCSSGDGGPATAATFCFARKLAVDDKGNLYITEINRVRKVSRDGTITTIAGTGIGKSGCSGDGGPATRARVNPSGAIGVDAKGNVYFSDSCPGGQLRCDPGCVRKVSRDGKITTFIPKISGRVAVDSQGNVYITHYGDVFKVTPGGKITPFLGAPSLVVDGRRGPVKPRELAAGPIAVYGRGALVIYSHGRIFKATAR